MISPISRRVLARQSFRGLSTRPYSSSPRAEAGDHVRIVEVGPRDGLQNEKTSISVDTKLELVRRLAGTGLSTIEAGSFVAPKWVPQMAASDQVLSSVLRSPPSSPSPIIYQWLLPNAKGFDNFLKTMESSSPGSGGCPTPPPSPQQDSGPALNTSSADPNAMPSASSATEGMSMPRTPSESAPNERNGHKHEISIFMAATEGFSKRNTNCSIQESLDRFRPLMADAKRAGFPVRAYISVALGCPFEGVDVDPHRVADLAVDLMEMGADELSVADTTGMGTAPNTRKLLRTLHEAGVRSEDLAVHFHDTFGQALINTLVSLEAGIRAFDSAVGGLGGCPYSPGATGNVSTEDLVYTLQTVGMRTGVDLEEVSRIGDWITGEIGKMNSSGVGRATMARLRKAAE